MATSDRSTEEQVAEASRLVEQCVHEIMRTTGWDKWQTGRYIAAAAAGLAHGIGLSWDEFAESAKLGWSGAKKMLEGRGT